MGDSFAGLLIRRGLKHYSVKAVFERVRWEKDMGVTVKRSSDKQLRTVLRPEVYKNTHSMMVFQDAEADQQDKPATNMPDIIVFERAAHG